jgi:phosphoribosylformylglycinamidine cyclo-ligase
LVRRVVARSGLGWNAPAPFDSSQSLAAALLTPTRLYVLPLLDALKRTQGIHAFAHITGGGYPDNLPRALDAGLAVSLDLDAFTPQPVFSWLASVGGLDTEEMLRTFNCGFGMVAFVAAESGTEARDALAGAGLSPILIGKLVPAEGRRLVTQGRLKL